MVANNSKEMMELNTLETDRLLLRPLIPNQYDAIFQSYSDEELKRFFGLCTDEELVLEKQKQQGGLTTYSSSFILFHLIEKTTDRVIGGCGFHNWQARHFRAELGYSLIEESDKGKGFMKEALAPIIQFGFTEMHLHRIEALVGPNNIPSLKLVKSFGFKEEGRLREHYFINNQLEDSIVFSLLKREYLDNTGNATF